MKAPCPLVVAVCVNLMMQHLVRGRPASDRTVPCRQANLFDDVFVPHLRHLITEILLW